VRKTVDGTRFCTTPTRMSITAQATKKKIDCQHGNAHRRFS
jgi:hypothetical protein